MAIATAWKAVTFTGLVGSSPTSSANTIFYPVNPFSRDLRATRLVRVARGPPTQFTIGVNPFSREGGATRVAQF